VFLLKVAIYTFVWVISVNHLVFFLQYHFLIKNVIFLCYYIYTEVTMEY